MFYTFKCIFCNCRVYNLFLGLFHKVCMLIKKWKLGLFLKSFPPLSLYFVHFSSNCWNQIRKKDDCFELIIKSSIIFSNPQQIWSKNQWCDVAWTWSDVSPKEQGLDEHWTFVRVHVISNAQHPSSPTKCTVTPLSHECSSLEYRPSNREFVMTLFISENGLRHQKRGWS